MRLKRPRVASLDEVTITRESDAAIIAYKQPGILTTHLTLGPDVEFMTDQEILDRFNAGVRASEAMAATYHHVAVEIPAGSPQIEYFERGDQWTPRGDVLRCIVDDGGSSSSLTIASKRSLTSRCGSRTGTSSCPTVYASNSDRGIPLWRMMESNVPIAISA